VRTGKKLRRTGQKLVKFLSPNPDVRANGLKTTADGQKTGKISKSKYRRSCERVKNYGGRAKKLVKFLSPNTDVRSCERVKNYGGRAQNVCKCHRLVVYSTRPLVTKVCLLLQRRIERDVSLQHIGKEIFCLFCK
jgi:hypothetical protein